MIALAPRPPELAEATAPPEYRGIARDAVRMLVTDRARRAHAHARFCDLAHTLRPGDLLVVNDSRTLPAAILATKPNGQAIALHVATKVDARLWMTEPRGPVAPGEELRLPGAGRAVIVAPLEPERPRLWYAWFALPLPMNEYLDRYGEPIRYGYVPRQFPLHDYQTMFARESGSSEMPSAARPFTPRVVDALRRKDIELRAITLHCGVASFESPERPGAERFAVSHATAAAVNQVRREGRRVIAVGTTVLRALESAVDEGRVVAASGWTDLFIDERHRVTTANGLLTGFHDSAATHLSLLSAFLGRELLHSAYDAASAQAYYCHEFGDVHLIL